MADFQTLHILFVEGHSEDKAIAAQAKSRLDDLADDFDFAEVTPSLLEQYHSSPHVLVLFYDICIFQLRETCSADDIGALGQVCLDMCKPEYINKLWTQDWGEYQATVRNAFVEFLCVFALTRFPDSWNFLDPEEGIVGANIEARVAFLKRFCREISSPRPEYEMSAYHDIHRTLRDEDGFALILKTADDGLRKLVVGSADLLASLSRMGIVEWLGNDDLVGKFKEAWGYRSHVPACLRVVSEVVLNLAPDQGVLFLCQFQVLEKLNSLVPNVDSISADSINLARKAAKTVACIGIALYDTHLFQVIADTAINFLMCPCDKVSVLVLGFLEVLGLRALGNAELASLVRGIADKLVERLCDAFKRKPEMALNSFCEEVCHVFSVFLNRDPDDWKRYLWERLTSTNDMIEKAVLFYLIVELYYEGVEMAPYDWQSIVLHEYYPIFAKPVTDATWTIFVNFQKLLLRASNPAALKPFTDVSEWQPFFERCFTEFQKQQHPKIRKRLFDLLKKFPELKRGKIKVATDLLVDMYKDISLVPLASRLVDAMPLTKLEFIERHILPMFSNSHNVTGWLTFFALLQQPIGPCLAEQLIERFRLLYEHVSQTRNNNQLGLLIGSLKCVVGPNAFDLLEDILDQTDDCRDDFANAMAAGTLATFFKYSQEHAAVCRDTRLSCEPDKWVKEYAESMLQALSQYTEATLTRKELTETQLARYYCFFAHVLKWMNETSWNELCEITIRVLRNASTNLQIWGVVLSFMKRVLAQRNSDLTKLIRQVFTLFILIRKLDCTSKKFGNVTDMIVEILRWRRAIGEPSHQIVRKTLAKLGVPEGLVGEFISVVFSDADTSAVQSQVTVALYSIRLRCTGLYK